MKFNVQLDDEQISQIANVTADKVLKTVEYVKISEASYEREIESLRENIQIRDSMLVQKDLCIDRLRRRISDLRSQIKAISEGEDIVDKKE